ncbi:MAG TPA: S8 family serine peptidase [Streptosporangiaceae bacterium]|nr:S8 family serine peptidase [Streptosporangiaceae bacterium]
MVRGGGTARALCAAGLLLSGLAPAAQASGRGLPGPVPGCPPQLGTAAPALAPWPQKELGFASVWHLTRGAGVTVAVVDSGVDANPQFGDRVIRGPDLVAGTKKGIPPGADCVGHGTAVASIIAAAPMPGISFTGVAPAARILSVKISGTDTFPTAATPRGIMDAVQFGADAINLSLSTPDDVPALRQAVAYALSHNVVVVAAVGNDIPQNGTGPFYPAAYPGVLSVGAAGPGGTLAPFSDRRTPVGVIAPGVNVTSAYPGTFPDAYNPDQSGTSFAAAYVSGVVALVRAAHPRLNPAQVVARIEATARGSTGPGSGHGVIDPVRAVTADLPGDPAVAPAASPAQPGTSQTGTSQTGTSQPGTSQPGTSQTGTSPATGAAQAGGTSRARPEGHDTSAVTRAVIAGSFGLIVVVAVTAGLAISRRNRPPGSGPPGPPGSGRHAA